MNNKDSKFKKCIKAIFKFFLDIIKYFFIGIYQLLMALRIFFTIPLLTIGAGVLILVFLLIFKPIINFLPDSLNVGFIESFICFGIFTGLRFVIFRDKLLHDFDFDHNDNIRRFIISSVIWLIPIYFFRREGFYAQSFLAEGRIYTPLSFVYVVLYLPNMWLATITGEFYISVFVNVVINTIIVTLITVKFKNDFLKSD